MKADGQLPADTKLRSSKYLNNLIEQDHRGVKLRIDPMLGFKWFRTAAITLAGIELLRRDPQGTVQPRQAVRQRSKCACRLERGASSTIKQTMSDGHIGQPCLPVYLHQNRRGIVGEITKRARSTPQPACE
jgi:hypothetical protein